MATRASTGGREKPEAPLVKPQRFDGHRSLDTFLRQFEQLSNYMNWGERERRYHLGASLMGPASQVLKELPATGSTSTSHHAAASQIWYETASREFSGQTEISTP